MEKLKEAWRKAEETGEPVDIGDIVVCDFCNKDYTDSAEPGGFLFGSKGVCPACAPKMLESIQRYQEESYIRERANDGESFKDFIVRMRGGVNTIQVKKI